MIEVTARQIREIFSRLFGVTGLAAPFVLALRGSVKQGDWLVPATPDGVRYNCTLSTVSSKGIFTLPATTEPGKPWRDNPISAAGCGFVAEGVWSYRKGLHKGKYQALVQAGSVIVWRDVDRNKRITHGEDSPTISGGSFNVHQSWSLTSIGKDSAGCLVAGVLGTDPRWPRFLGNLENAVKVILVRYELLERAAKDGGFFCFSHGSRGHEVTQIQRVLGLHQDGVFGPHTMMAVREFQRKNRIRPDGIAGPDTLQAMGL